MRRINLLVSLFLVLLVVSMFGFMGTVKATENYYNWLRNPSFEQNVNLVEDNGFESGSFESGLVYGNWSISGGTPEISVAEPHSGLYSLLCGDAENAWYNFTESILGADIEGLSFYAYGASGADAVFRVYYSDYTYDTVTEDIGVDTWVLLDETSLINQAKYIVALRCLSTSGIVYYDDVYCLIFDAENINSQSNVDVNSEPWSLYDPAFVTVSFPTDNDISSLVYRTGLTSYRVIDEYSYPVRQLIDNLDSDLIHYIDLWVLSSYDAEIDITVTLHYTDGSASSRTITVEDSVSWQHINFGSYFIRDNAIISEFGFSVTGQTGGYALYIDDVALWASIPLGFNIFGYTFTPYPVYGYSGYSVTLRTQQSYILNGYLYDTETGELSGNGTAIFGTELGFYDDTVENGRFTITIPARTYPNGKLEYPALTIVLDDGESYVFGFTVNWISPPSGDTTNPEADRLNDIVTLIINFIFLFMPAIFFGYVAHKSEYIEPIVGIIGGLLLSSFLFYTVFGNILGVIVCVVVIGFIVLMNRRGTF